MPFAPSNIGIVGASGFVGSALANSLVLEGEHGVRLFGRKVGKVADQDIQPLSSGSTMFEGLDTLVHLSGLTDSRASDGDLRRANTDLAVDMARAAATAKVKRFVFISSMAVYGRSAAHAISPDMPLSPDNGYGRSKAAAEVAMARVADETGLELIILRPPMVYGRGSKGSFAALARLVRSGLPLPFKGARGLRSFCSIGNLVSAMRHAIDSAAPGSILIPADPEDFDTPGLVRAMADAMERPVRLWRAPKPLPVAPLAMIGRAEMITSLFEPLRVDRSHWKGHGWRPVETGRQGVNAALEPLERAE